MKTHQTKPSGGTRYEITGLHSANVSKAESHKKNKNEQTFAEIWRLHATWDPEQETFAIKGIWGQAVTPKQGPRAR